MLIRLRAIIKSLLATVVLLTTTSLSALELTEAERAWLAAHPVIQVGIDPAWPPYEFIDEQGKHEVEFAFNG